MPYMGAYFGPNNGDEYLDDWFDGSDIPPPSANGGASKARILGTTAPRPQVPPWRHIADKPTGMMLQEIRRFLNEVAERSNLWGNHVEVTFPNGTDSVRVDTGLGGPAKSYVREGGDSITVSDGSPPAGSDPTPERGIIWLKGSAAGTVRLLIY